MGSRSLSSISSLGWKNNSPTRSTIALEIFICKALLLLSKKASGLVFFWLSKNFFLLTIPGTPSKPRRVLVDELNSTAQAGMAPSTPLHSQSICASYTLPYWFPDQDGHKIDTGQYQHCP
uniref:Uncharacterized protein n=1 Tax=Physcomitrium patens TaxID=3218 RepID=A0A2K1JQQ4_PHYPA|nr:hypothetical protein PHYPA_016244 [Physcomitrium patens]